MPLQQNSQNPKFYNNIKDVINHEKNVQTRDTLGIISSYNRATNTATVLALDPASDTIAGIYEKVPCPVFPGIQMSAPRPGRACWLNFRGSGTTDSRPFIVAYYSHDFVRKDYNNAYQSRTGILQYNLTM